MDIIISTLLLLYSMLAGTGSESSSAGQLALTYLEAVSNHASSAQNAPLGGYRPGVSVDGGMHSVKKDPQPDTPAIKGIYVTAHSAGGERMPSLLKLVKDTQLNSMVIDIKDDNGFITFPTTSPELLEIGEPKRYIADIGKLMSTLKQNDIYPIARIVVFKDAVLARKKPELSFLNQDGTIWKNNRGESFVNPYSKEVWDYNIAVAKEAAKMGFREIQFDYVRFPEGFDGKSSSLLYSKSKTDKSRVEAVSSFVGYAREQLEPLGIRVSVDIFGYAASVPSAEEIGQDFVQISNHVHVISPMIYPSHYSTGWFKQKAPDLHPYETVTGAMLDTHKKLDSAGELKPIIRPWIQDFTASWLGEGNYMRYGKAEVEAQIQALHDNGIEQYLLWNAGNKYTPDVDYN